MSMEHETNTILDIATKSDSFDILEAALGAFPDLVDAAGAAMPKLTVFAPTDEAFTNLAKALGYEVESETDVVKALINASELLSPAGNPTGFLESVLTYHIAVGEFDGKKVASSRSIETLSGETIKPKVKDGNLSLGDKDDSPDPSVVNPDDEANGIVADNGIIHVIDSVLLPFDITFAKGGFLFTGRGEDVVIGSDHFDFIGLGKGDDIANGFGGHDFIFGGRGKDLIKGGEGDDYLNGGRGKDELEGEQGDDFLVGGRSADNFVFNPFREGEGHDVIADFNIKRDKLVLDLSDGDPDDLAAIASFGDPGLQITDLLFFDLDDSTPEVDAAVSLGASDDGDLLITHINGTIELNGVSPDVDAGKLLAAIEIVPQDLIA